MSHYVHGFQRKEKPLASASMKASARRMLYHLKKDKQEKRKIKKSKVNVKTEPSDDVASDEETLSGVSDGDVPDIILGEDSDKKLLVTSGRVQLI